jgi:hypothetical protein
MTVDLSYDELVLLVQLVQQRFVEIQRKTLKPRYPLITRFGQSLDSNPI